MKYELLINGVRRSVTFIPPSNETSRMAAIIDGRSVEADIARILPGAYSILLDGRSLEVTVEKTMEGLLVHAAKGEFQVQITDPRSWRGRQGGKIELEGRQQVAAPMPGKVVRVLIVEGQKVEAGQGLLVIEAMKMQNEIGSPKSGTVERVVPKEGQTVAAAEVLVIIA